MALDLSLGLSVFFRNVQHILSICHMRFVTLKGVTGCAQEDEIVVWEQISLGGYHGQMKISVCAN